MSIDKATVAKISALARLSVSESAHNKLAEELSNIIGWIEQLNEVDTQNTSPMTSVVDVPLRRREDVVNDGNCRDEVLENAPETKAGFYVVPKVVE
jgi:aspartyl-tRNA(Asn)/glutamyl-tRNA(Gln) amidotransferase subunit C